MSPVQNDAEAAEAALRLVQSANEDMAHRAVAPVWYHPVLGGLVGGILAVQAAPLPVRGAYFALYGLGLALLVQAYRKRTGVWVSGLRRGRTLFVTLGGLVLTVIAMLAAARYGMRGVTEAWFVGGAAVAVVVTATSVLWEVVYRAEMRGDR